MGCSRSFVSVIAVFAVAVAVAAMGAAAPVAAQGGLAISTDRSQYRVGETVRYCVEIPGSGHVRIVNLLPDGRSQVLQSFNSPGGRRCFTATVTPPTGTECLRVEFRDGVAQVCFEVRPSVGSPSGPGRITVTVDRGAGATYGVGDPIQICYRAELFPTFAPVRAEVQLVDILPNGVSRLLLTSSELERCLDSTVTRPLGTETIRADLRICNVTPPVQTCPVSATAEVSFLVTEPGPPPPPPPDGSISVTIDRGPGATYAVGDPIQICYTAQAPPVITIVRIEVRLTLLLPDGRSRVLSQSTDLSRCIDRTVERPTGRHAVLGELFFCGLDAPRRCSVAAADQVSFFVVEQPPPPPSGRITVTVDRGPWSTYAVGDPIQICYRTDAFAIAIIRLEVRLTDILSDGTTRVIFEGPELERCLHGTVTRPLGPETIRAELLFCDLNTPPRCQVGGTDEVTFFVVRGAPPPGGAFIRTDRFEYRPGDPIRICYDVPGPSWVMITDIHADGHSHVLLAGDDDGTGGCFFGIVTPPFGTECLRLDYVGGFGSGSRETCFEVVGFALEGAWISTDRFDYRVGDPIQICFGVPGAGPVAVTDLLPDGRSQLIFADFNDGSGGCFNAMIIPPTGTECLRLDYTTTGGSGSIQTCFRVHSVLF